MFNLFFPAAGRVSRRSFWMAQLGYLAVMVVSGVVFYGLSLVIPNESHEPGQFSVNGANAIPFIVVGLASTLLVIVSSIVVAIKRYHDRDKSGYWYLINFVPFIGALWCFIELGFLSGTPGFNRFGPAPRRGDAALAVA